MSFQLLYSSIYLNINNKVPITANNALRVGKLEIRLNFQNYQVGKRFMEF